MIVYVIPVAFLASIKRCGIFRSDLCVDLLTKPSGSLLLSLYVSSSSTHSLSISRKLHVVPESANVIKNVWHWNYQNNVRSRVGLYEIKDNMFFM